MAKVKLEDLTCMTSSDIKHYLISNDNNILPEKVKSKFTDDIDAYSISVLKSRIYQFLSGIITQRFLNNTL